MATPVATPPPAQVLAWDKGKPQVKPSTKKSNPLASLALIAMVVLAGSGMWRMFHTQPTTAMVKVLTPNHDVSAGTKLQFMSVKYMEIPRKLATSDMMTSLNEINGRMARGFMPANEPITTDKLFPTTRGIAGVLENDERAITIQLRDDALVDHTIQPDDRVDILAITTAKDGKRYTKTICQSVKVLMAAPKEQALFRRDGPTDMITLAVIPSVGEAINEALEVGKIRLVLRNRLARTPQILAGVGPDDLLPSFANKPVDAPIPNSIGDNTKMSLPPPPSLANMELPTLPPVEDTYPGKWIVEMLSGNHKELVDVPPR
jgi:Flp pilus assembly protein CpaB